MAPGPKPIPLPPGVAPSNLPALVADPLDALWRLHWEPDPRAPNAHPTGRFRFDAPDGEYLVTYGSDDRFACFGEVYGDRQSIPPTDMARKLSSIRANRPLRFITLDDGETLKALHSELDGRVASDIHYTVTRAWSLALHAWYKDADGIRYVARHGTPHLNRCLFLDRCASSLEVEEEGELGELRDLVVRACDAYALAPRLFESRDPGGW